MTVGGLGSMSGPDLEGRPAAFLVVVGLLCAAVGLLGRRIWIAAVAVAIGGIVCLLLSAYEFDHVPL